jgi:hypothetical protein
VNTGQLLQNFDRSRSMGIITREPVETKGASIVSFH